MKKKNNIINMFLRNGYPGNLGGPAEPSKEVHTTLVTVESDFQIPDLVLSNIIYRTHVAGAVLPAPS